MSAPRRALKVIVAIACVAAAPSVAIAATSGASGKPFAINCSSEQFKPKRIIISCADAGTWLGKLKWSSWTGSSATGAGTYNANTCTPDCAAGKIKSYPVKVSLSKAKTCPGQTHAAFKQAALTYAGTRPKGAPAKVSFRCPVLPGEY
ncbi:MAG TPA: hypothetical protein VMA77_28220 [Solirubrobacteraceae bacterium]|nr:hypothetical protein [Solirubrobacteraceae bacterium]